jgi:cell division protein FtsB
MNVDLGIWGKLTRVIVFLLLLAGVLAVVVWYLPLIQQNQRMRRELLRLNLDIQNEEIQAKQLKAAINALQKDPKTVERLARERLGYAKPGETVIRFGPSETNANSSKP